MRWRSMVLVAFVAMAANCEGAVTPATRPADQILKDAAANASWPYLKTSFKSHVHWTKDFGRVQAATIDTLHVYGPGGKDRLEMTMSVERNDVRGRPKPDTWISIVSDNKYVFFKEMPEGQKTYVHYSDAQKRVEQWRRGMRLDMGSGGFLDGGIAEPAATSIFELAGKSGSPFTVTRDTIEGVGCYLLRCELRNGSKSLLEGGTGELKIWVAESLGDSVVAYSVEEKGFIEEKKDDGSVKRRTASLKISFSNAKVEKLGEHFFVRAGRYELKLTKDGEVESTIAEGERDDFDTSPKFGEMQFTFAGIAEGSKVGWDGKSGGFIWQGGKPVPELRVDLPLPGRFK